jgi:hypothetical protein
VFSLSTPCRKSIIPCLNEENNLRRIANVNITDRTTNERIREICGLKQSVVERMKVNTLRWFGHMERKNEEKLTKIIYKAERVSEKRRGRPRIGWMKGIENILKDVVRSTRYRRACMRVEEARDVCKYRVRWNSVLFAYPVRDMA